MKHIKQYENYKVRYLKKGENIGNKFNRDEYVTLINDYVNGTPVENISKQVFQIAEIQKPNKNNIIFNCLLKYPISGKLYQWVREETLQLATEEQVANIELDYDANKYNL